MPEGLRIFVQRREVLNQPPVDEDGAAADLAQEDPFALEIDRSVGLQNSAPALKLRAGASSIRRIVTQLNVASP